MNEAELLGELFTSHPDVIPIILTIREKYQIPEVRPEDDIDGILLSRDDIDWEAVRQDIEEQVKNSPLFADPQIAAIRKMSQYQGISLDFPELAPLEPEAREQIKNMFAMTIGFFTNINAMVADETYKPTADMIFEYLLTGKKREAPQSWFSKVFVMDAGGEKIVVAMANEASDPKEIAEKFKSEFTRTFGKDRPKITETHLETAEYLAEKLAGKSPKFLVEMYQERHPDEFPRNRSSKEYRETVERHKRMMEKRIQRLQAVINKWVADKK